jgi:CARDB
VTTSALMQVTLPDLVETSASVLALSVGPGGSFSVPGGSFSVRDTVQNVSPVSAPDSTTRYYLSIDLAKGAGDVLLTGSRAVAALAPSGASTGAATVTVPAATAPGTYHVLVCADDTNLVKEVNENNCRVAGQLLVRRVSAPAL